MASSLSGVAFSAACACERRLISTRRFLLSPMAENGFLLRFARRTINCWKLHLVVRVQLAMCTWALSQASKRLLHRTQHSARHGSQSTRFFRLSTQNNGAALYIYFSFVETSISSCESSLAYAPDIQQLIECFLTCQK